MADTPIDEGTLALAFEFMKAPNANVYSDEMNFIYTEIETFITQELMDRDEKIQELLSISKQKLTKPTEFNKNNEMFIAKVPGETGKYALAYKASNPLTHMMDYVISNKISSETIQKMADAYAKSNPKKSQEIRKAALENSDYYARWRIMSSALKPNVASQVQFSLVTGPFASNFIIHATEKDIKTGDDEYDKELYKKIVKINDQIKDKIIQTLKANNYVGDFKFGQNSFFDIYPPLRHPEDYRLPYRLIYSFLDPKNIGQITTVEIDMDNPYITDLDLIEMAKLEKIRDPKNTAELEKFGYGKYDFSNPNNIVRVDTVLESKASQDPVPLVSFTAGHIKQSTTEQGTTVTSSTPKKTTNES